MRRYLLPETGKFYKANLHNHTTVSDGKFTPAEAKAAYMAHGYNIIAFTDHEKMIDQSELNDENFMAITSYEISLNDPDPKHYGKCCHFNLYSKDAHNPVQLDLSDRTYSVERMNEVIRYANENGYLVCYNHPHWSLANYEDYAYLKDLWGVEVINYSSALCGYSGDYNSNAYEQMLRNGQHVFAVASDDNHDWAPEDSPAFDSFGGFTMIKADRLDYPSIIESMEKGNFYCSGRPLIHQLYIEDNKIHIETSPVREITLSCIDRTFRPVFADRSGLLTHAEYDIPNSGAVFFRIELVDAEGAKAFTNPYFIDEIL